MRSAWAGRIGATANDTNEIALQKRLAVALCAGLLAVCLRAATTRRGDGEGLGKASRTTILRLLIVVPIAWLLMLSAWPWPL